MLIVFDLDGTLVDSQRDLAAAVNALLLEYGGTPLSEEAVAAMVGDGAAVLVRRALAAAGIAAGGEAGALARFLSIYESALLVHTRPYEGTVEMLARLDGAHRLAVLTNKPSRATREILSGLHLLSRFADVIGGDTRLGRKPDPAGLRELVGRAGLSAASTLLVGDSPVDLETARQAGVAICLARYGFGFRFAEGEFSGEETFIDRPMDLLEVVSRLEAAAR